jgi:hypothetical protein
MKFVLLAYGDEKKMSTLTPPEMRALGAKCKAFDAELHATGRVVGTGSLSWRAKHLRPTPGEAKVTDGPFTETKEVVGGLVIIEADDFDDAVRIARLHPAARVGAELGWWIELRPMETCALKQVALDLTGVRDPLRV